jgi:cobyric acid synthase CobQ
MAKSIMIQGTCSNAGKSIIVTGLCRIFLEDGYSVTPFKSQNMALNSFVTEDNFEMGRAQVTQAYACRLKPDVKMNPILLKPSSDTGSQVIVKGKPIGTMNFRKYKAQKNDLIPIIRDCYEELSRENDIVVIEGAGSPAEINLKEDDIVNMHIAKMTKAPVLIVGDIDRGGVFASFIGTYELLDKFEKEITKGFIINKFRGDPSLLQPAINFTEKKTGKKIYGIVPYLNNIRIPDEDSVEFKKSVGKNIYNSNKEINIALIDLPHISNFTDFDAFHKEKDVNFYAVNHPDKINDADIIILPGSKNVIGDLQYLKKMGFDKVITSLSKKNKMIVGICGGYQMLGNNIEDPHTLESNTGNEKGLKLLSLNTILEKEKSLSQTQAICKGAEIKITGYEIHHGNTDSDEKPFILNNKNEVIGVKKGNIWGTYLHGIFDNNELRRHVINIVRGQKKLKPLPVVDSYNLDIEISKLADILRKSLDLKKIYKLMGL